MDFNLTGWKRLPRGTWRYELNPFEIDVFKVHGIGWRYNILNTQTNQYVATKLGYASLGDCMQDSINAARLLLHPIKFN